MRRAKTETIITALRILADEIHSDDGVANAALREAADRLAELHASAPRQCVWTRDDDLDATYDGACGIRWGFVDGGPRQNSANYCPRCGGRIKLAKRPE